MKIRSGFISNSSSSSFIIVSKKGPLTVQKLIEIFKVPKESLMYPLAEGLAKVLIGCSDKTTTKEILSNYGADDISDLPDYMQNALKSNGIVYDGSVANDSEDGMEVALVDMELDFEDDNIIVKKEAGY